LTTQSSSNI